MKLVKRGSNDWKLENEDCVGVAQVLREMVSQWVNTQMIFCADLYFELVIVVELLFVNGMKFTGMVKTTMCKFLMVYLAAQEIKNRGTLMNFCNRE